MQFLPIEVIYCIVILIVINFLMKKSQLLLDKPELSYHKIRHKKKIPLSGGIYVVISILTILLINSINYFNLIFLVPFLLIGILADTKKNFSPKLRLLLQLVFIIFIIKYFNISIQSIELKIFDKILTYPFFNFIFVTFCIITVLNGYNFMDGLNGFVVGHLLMIVITTYFLIIYRDILISQDLIQLNLYFIYIFFVFYFFNLFGKCFFGDNGIYVISISISLFIIIFVENSNNIVSPLFAASMLWYPAYENLFSIIRRLRRGRYVSKPDKLHLHYLIQAYLFHKLNIKVITEKLNSISGFILNLILIPNFFFSFLWFNSSKKLILLIIVQAAIYTLIYLRLIKAKLEKI